MKNWKGPRTPHQVSIYRLREDGTRELAREESGWTAYSRLRRSKSRMPSNKELLREWKKRIGA